MAQTGYTPIQLYYSTTATQAPLAASLANGELAINITDGKLFYKDNSAAVQVIGWKVVPATAGGTGQTSYAVGDLLYSDTTTTLAKLADVATGNALISGGVGVAPSYGKIGLTTHVSGTLAVGNGGTGATTFTTGQVLFGNSTSAINTSANLFWDNANARLGIGTASPTVALDVVGAINLTGNAVFGDAATDTVRVNGYMGVGGAANSAYGILSTGAATSGANQYSVGVTATLGGTTWSSAYLAGMTIAASTTASSGAGLRVINPTLASGAAIGTNYGVRVEDLTVGTNNYGVGLAVSSGTGKYNIYANGTASNYIEGNVGIGAIGATATKLDVTTSSATGYSNLNLYSSSASYAGSFCRFFINSATAATYEFLRMFTATGEVLRIAGNGNITNINGSYGTLSDIKLKENIVDATPKLDNLMRVRVVNYNLKDNPEQKQIGVVAQELEQVFPGLIYELRDTDKEGEDLGTTTKSVKYSVFVPMLIKAIQEQQSLINELQADVAALKTK
jgi:hypothetical protein